jgi:hypothetical protein
MGLLSVELCPAAFGSIERYKLLATYLVQEQRRAACVACLKEADSLNE